MVASAVPVVRLIALLASVVAPLLTFADEAASLVVSYSGRTVFVAGATAGEPVVIFGMSRQMVGWDTIARNYAFVAHAAADGSVTSEQPEEITDRTVLVAVDYITGRRAFTGGKSQQTLRTLPAESLKKRDGEYEFVDMSGSWVEVLCVRPRHGAWQMFLTDGAALDRDGRHDNRTTISAVDMKSLYGDAPTPKKFRKGDVVVVIEPRALRVWATEVAE